MNILKILKSYKKELTIGPLFKLIEAIIEIMLPIIIAKIIDNASTLTGQQIFKYCLLLIFLILVGFGAACISQYYAARTSQVYGTKLREKVINKISKLSEKQINNIGTSAIVNRIINDINNLEVAIAMFIRLVLRVPFICIGSLIMIFYIDRKIGIMVSTSAILLGISIYAIFKISSKIQRKLNLNIDKFLVKIKESLLNIRLIKSFGSEEYEKNKVENDNLNIRKLAFKYNKVSNLLAPTSTVILDMVIIAVLFAYKISINDISTGNLIAIINYISQMISAVIVFSNLIVIYTKAFVSAKRIEEMMDLVPEMNYGIESEFEKNDIAIDFMNVDFSYNEINKNLQNINFEIKQGEIIGIIGLTGSGKTTILNLISRKYDISNGEIYLFGKDIKEYSKNTLKDNVVIISQKKNFFTDTIDNNIKLRKEN